MKEALAAGGDVKLGADINVATQIEIPAGVTVVLDLAGYDIIGGLNGSSTTNHIYVLSNRGTLTIKDSGTEGKIVSRGIYNYGKLTLVSGTIDACDGNGGYAVNNESGSTFIMNGGVVSASYEDGDAPTTGNYDATALDVPAGCTATLNGGKITSVTNYTYAISLAGELIVPETSTVEVAGAHGAISMSAGSADIDGGKFICSGVQGQTDNVLYVTGGTMDISGGTFEGDSDNAGGCCVCDLAGVATINGGSFSKSSGGDVNGTTGTTINGGTFENLTETQHVAVGATITNGGKTYTKAENGDMVEAAIVEVATYDELVAALANGGKIKLTADITVDTKITAIDGTELDLNEKTLYINVENSYYNNVTVKNGNIVLGKDDVTVCDGYFLINDGKTLVLDGVNMSSSAEGIKGYAVFHLKTGANLDLLNSTLNIADNEYSAGYIVYAGEATATVDIVKTTITGSKVNGIVHATTVIDESTVTLTNVIEHGINRSGVTIDDSNVAISGGTGRGITAQHGDLVVTGNSTVDIKDMGEATIELRNDKNLSVAETATVTLDVAVNNTTNGTISGTVNLPVVYVAKIGETEYSDFAAALTAASAMSGDVTVEVYDKVTLNTAFSGNYSSINFVGKDTDAEIYLDVQGYITATGKKVSFTDLTLSKSAGGYMTNAGFMNVAFGIYDVAEVTYTNCVFANGAYASSGNVTFNDCTFYRSHDKYGLWAYGNVDATVEGCTFADYRGIKMYAEGAAKTVDLTVKNTDFSAVTDKPAIVLTYGESVVLEGNTYSSTGTFELDLDGAPNGTAVTSDVAPTCKNDNGDCGVLVDGKIYTTVAQAVEVATEGSNVTLLYSTTETAEFAEGVNLTLADGVTADNVTVATPVYVAKIGDVEYTSLQEAIEAAQADETVTLLADVTTADGVVITDKNLTIDLNGKTYTTTEGASTNNRNFKIEGTSVVTIKNGTMVAAGDYSSGAYGTVRTEGSANVTLEGLKLYNYRGNGLNIKACAGTTVTVKDTEIYANYGGGIESAGGTIEIANVKVEQKGMYTAPYNSMAISVNGGGKVTVNSGTFSTECITAEEANNQGSSHGPWVAGVLNSGGTLIINGGTFSNDNFGENSLATYARGAILADTKAKVEINGGKFNVLKNVIDIQNNLGDANNNPSVVLAGGTYNADPRISAQYGSNLITLADGYVALPDLAGHYVVGVKPTATVNNLGMTTIPAGDYSIYNGSFDQNTEDDGDMPLSFVMQFLADQDAEDMETSPYADWYGDFVITFTGLESGSFTANGCYLAGHYGSFGWVKVPVDGMEIEEGVRYPVMLGVGLGQKYDYICSSVEDFKCALYLTPEILAANPNIQVKLELGVVDNSQGPDAAASALIDNENVYSVTEYTYDAEDFVAKKDPEVVDGKIEFVDGEFDSYTNDTDIENVEITYKRTIDTDWNALYVPFAIPASELLDNFDIAYINDVRETDSDDDGELDSWQMELIKIKKETVTLNANHPYFIRSKSVDAGENNLNITLTTTLCKATVTELTCTSMYSAYTVKGLNELRASTEFGEADRVLGYNNGETTWGKMADGYSLKPFRFYLTIEGGVDMYSSAQMSIVVRGEDGTTGVDEIVGENAEEMIFDLQGRRVLEPQKGGLYIINGKKVIF